MNIIYYLNIFQSCAVEVIDNIVLPKNMHNNIDIIVKFPVIRTSNAYKETSPQKLGSDRSNFYMLCDNKPVLPITTKVTENQSTSSNKNPHVSCEATVYITPFKNCKSWSVNPSQTSTKSKSTDNSNNVSDFPQKDEEISPIYRKGKYYIIISNANTVSQQYNGHVFYEIDIPPKAPLGSLSLALHTKFYLEVTKSDASFYLAKMENVADIVERVKKQCADSENNKGFLKLFSLTCVMSNYMKSKYIFYKLVVNNPDLEKIVADTIRYDEQSYQNIHWVLKCPNCNFEFSGTHKSKMGYRLMNWRGQPSLELIIIFSMFRNSTVLTDFRFADKNLPLPQILIDQNVMRMQFVRIENTGFHFVTCANILETNGLSLRGLVSSFDVFTWLGLILISVLSIFVLIGLLKYSNIEYDIFEVCLLTIKIILEQNIPNFRGNTCFITGAWMLVGVIISQCYRGDNVTHLTAPIKKSKLDYYYQLLEGNFSFLSPTSFQSVLKREKDTIDAVDGLTSLFSKIVPKKSGDKTFMDKFVTEFEMTYANSGTMKNTSIIDKIRASLSRPEQLQNLSEVVSDSNYFVDMLQSCGRQAYLGIYDNAFSIYNKLRERLKIRGSNFMEGLSLSKETLAPTVTTWRFEKVPVIDSDQFIIRVQSFLHSGIIDLWKKWNLRIKTYNDTVLVVKTSKSHVKSLSVHDNVMVVFYLWIGFLGFTCIIFGKEILASFLMKTMLMNGNAKKVSNEVLSINISGSI